MPLKSMKDEIVKEIEAVQQFIKLAIEAQQNGYTKAAVFFLSEAKEDCEHAFLYAREIDKHNNDNKNTRSIMDITKSYAELEESAIDRISDMYKKAHIEEITSVFPFITKMMSIHTEDAYRAKKMLQKIETLFSAESLTDIEYIFENETSEEN